MQKGKPHSSCSNHSLPADNSPAGAHPLAGLAPSAESPPSDNASPSGKSLYSGQAPDGEAAFNPWSDQPTLGDLLSRRLDRRGALARMAAFTAGALAVAKAEAAPVRNTGPTGLTFEEVPHGYDPLLHVPPGYEAKALLRWGEPLTAGAPAFDPHHQSADAQEQQFGYNNDFIAFMPLTADGQRPKGTETPQELSRRGLLSVNHEYTILHLMFPGVRIKTATKNKTREQAEIELAAHGHAVVEVQRTAAGWQRVPGSRYNRRISARSTEMHLSGPAAGSPKLRTNADPTGKRVIGTLNNCAGGFTPWGTVLSGEENFNAYFAGQGPVEDARHRERYNVGPTSVYAFSRFFDRFDLDKEPNEPNRFGWVVEIDPYDPQSTPIKRTALGRFKHEGATATRSADGRIAVYSGDDQTFNYLYRFVTAKAYDPAHPTAARNLLDEGTLYALQLLEDGRARWLPLVHGTGPLTSASGFHSQADVLIETRRAADLLKATPLDRPEDVEVSPRTGRVYVMLSNNAERSLPGPAAPRPNNLHGQILELIPPGEGTVADHGADEYRWDVLLLAGSPFKEADGAHYHPDVSASGWLSCPDNCAFDPEGRLWIATDGAPSAAHIGDGLYVCETSGPARALTRKFFRAPQGAETTGPCFTPDGTTLFLSVQHPGDDKGSNFDHPSTRWPDFDDNLPPRPSVVAITRKDGSAIGT